MLNERRGDFERKLIFRFERAEGAGHAAAAGIEESGGSAGQTRGESCHEPCFHERLRVAMGMDRHLAGHVVESKSVWFALEQFFDELFEEMAAPGNRLRVGQLQFA